MPPPRWSGSSAALTVLVLGALASPALAQFCAIDPISPLCCPSPCPVVDPMRVSKLLADVDALGQTVGLDTQIVQTATQIGQSIGDAKAAATAMSQQLASFAGTVPSEISTIQGGLSANPVQALASLRESLFETAGGFSTTTQMASRLSARLAAAQGEQIGAFAVSLMRSKELPSLAPQQSQLAGTATGSQQLQGDIAANSASRLALYQDVGAIHQLVSAWVSQRSMQAGMQHPNLAGGTMVSPTTAASSPVSSSSPSPTQALAGAMDQLVALHDARVTAQAVLSSYPALQQTIASAALAGQFTSDAELALGHSLSSVGLSSASVSDVEKALVRADSTGWLDSSKTAAAQQAVLTVSGALLAAGGASQASADGGIAAAQQLQSAMASWLDADKQSRYWANLATQAKQSIVTLDATLGALSDRVGVDVAGKAGAASEKALLAKLSTDPAAGQWKALMVAAAQDPSARSVLKYAGTP